MDGYDGYILSSLHDTFTDLKTVEIRTFDLICDVIDCKEICGIGPLTWIACMHTPGSTIPN